MAENLTQRNIKKRNEYYPGKIVDTNYTGDGYTYDRAKQVAKEIHRDMLSAKCTTEVNVTVEPLSDGTYCVHNTSSYESRL